MKRAVVIGSGAGGAMMAKELQGSYEVVVLEGGREFKPLGINLSLLEPVRRTGLLFDERMIRMLFPAMRVTKTPDMALVYGICTGGTTTLATANALRCDEDLRALGIDLDAEFEELQSEVPQTIDHQKQWSRETRSVFEAFEKRGLEPHPLPKMLNAQNCVRCGKCVLGCAYGAKWDSRLLLKQATEAGAKLRTGCRVERFDISNGFVRSVVFKERGKRKELEADLYILAAGGLGSPLVLERSGIACEKTLFVDPVLCVAAPYEKAGFDKQLPMPFVSERKDYILSPYFDYLSFYFNKSWRIPPANILSLMIKLADANKGAVTSQGIQKTLTTTDKESLQRGVEDCLAVLDELGISRETSFLGTINAGHPGGTLPLTQQDAATLHPHVLPQNLYVADATLLPDSLGKPPILTIMALVKKVAKVCRNTLL